MEVTRQMVEDAFRNDYAATTVLLAPLWLEAHSADIGILFNYAEMLCKMTRYEEAIGVYQNALGMVGEDGRWAIYNQLGRLYQYWGQPARAEPWFRLAIEAEPDELPSYVLLGACQARQGKLREAEATHRAGAELTESLLHDEVLHNLGLVLRGQGRLSEAAEWFRKAIEIDPNYEDAIEALVDVETAMAFVRE